MKGLAQYSIEVRLKARDAYLHGNSFKKIATDLKVDSWRTVANWAKRGHWRELREDIVIEMEKKQLRKVRADISRQINKNAKILEFVESYLMKHFVEVGTNGAIKLRNNFRIKSADGVIYALMALVSNRSQLVKQATDLMGTMNSKLDLSTLSLDQFPTIDLSTFELASSDDENGKEN